MKRAGGHVLGEHGWQIAELAGDAPGDDLVEELPPLSMSNTKAELLAAADAAGVDADKSMTKAEILEVLDADQ